MPELKIILAVILVAALSLGGFFIDHQNTKIEHLNEGVTIRDGVIKSMQEGIALDVASDKVTETTTVSVITQEKTADKAFAEHADSKVKTEAAVRAKYDKLRQDELGRNKIEPVIPKQAQDETIATAQANELSLVRITASWLYFCSLEPNALECQTPSGNVP